MSTDAASIGAARPDTSARASSGAPSAPWPKAGVAYYTLFLMILSLTSLQLDTAIVPYVAGSIKHDLHISDTSLSLLLGLAFGLFYTLVGIPIAWIVDRYSRKWIIAIGLATWSLGTALCGVAQGYIQLFLARFVVGAGEAGNGPASYSVLADLFPREKMPLAVALLQAGSVIGPALALGASAFALKAFLDMTPIVEPWGLLHGWQLVLIIVGLPGVLIAVLMVLTMPETPRRRLANQIGREMSPPPTDLVGGFVAGLKDYWIALVYMARHWKVFGPMFGGLFVGSLGVGGLQWMPIFYQRTFNWGPAQLAVLQAISSLVFMPLGMIAGVIFAERFAKAGKDDAALRVLVISRLIGIPAMFAVLMPNPWLTWGIGALALFALGFGAPSQNAAMQIVTPAELRGKITALYLFIYSVVGIALSPAIPALLTDYFFKDESLIRWSIFLPNAIFGPLSLLIIWLGVRPYAKEIGRIRELEGQTG
jgi:MFS family permease